MIFDDYLDFFELLNEHKAKYVLVGGLAVVINGFFRTTKDMDLYIEPTIENCKKVVDVINAFGFKYLKISPEDLIDSNGFVQLGNTPIRIDLFSELPGLTFQDVYDNSFIYDQEKIPFRVIHINHLIANKKAVGRSQDITDVRNLEKIVILKNKQK